MALNIFNNKDLLRDIRLGTLNPMVEATNANTLDINTLRGNVAGISKRLGFIEPEVKINSTNLTALNQFAHAVAQQVSMTYDKSRVDSGNKLITFTAVGGSEKTLDLSPMFIDPVQTKIDISALENEPGVIHSVHQVNFKGNVSLSMDTTDRNRGDVFIPYLRGKIAEKSSNITKVELTGDTKLCSIDRGTLTINIPEATVGGPGGLFLDPNPPEANKNLFKAATQGEAEAARDAHFVANPTDLDTYKANTLKAILVEWMDGSDVQLMFQCQHNGNWENPFDIVFASFNIGRHSIEELRDGSRIPTLEAETLISAVSVGDGVDVYQRTHGRNLFFRKVRSNSPDLVVSTNDTGDHEVVFHTRPYWAGYFNTPAEASTNIPEADRITNKTTILTQNIHSEHSLHVWDGTNWVDKNIAEHGDISEDGGVNWMTLKGITNGDNIALTKIPVAGGTYYHRIDAISPVFAKVTGMTSPSRISSIEVANQYAEVQGATLKLPVVSAIDANAGDLGQIKNIKQGNNIEFDMDSTGVLVIKADKTDPITATVGSIATPTQISKIEDPSTFSTIDGGTLKLHRMDVVNSDGSSAGLIKSIKAGENITLTRDTGGTLTFSSSGGGGGTTFIQAKTGVQGSAYAPVTKIDVLDTFSKVEEGVLTVNAINCKDNAGTEQGFIKTLKAGTNVTLAYSNDDLNKGVVTINATGGGGGGTSMQGKVTGGNFANQYLPITQIDVTTDSNLSRLTKNTDDTYTMSFDTRSFVASNATKEGLEAAFPISTNAYRYGYVGNTGETYFTDGTSWFLQNYKGMPEQVISLNARYPEQQVTSPGNYDLNKKDSGMYYVTKDQCPIKPDEQKEYGMLENITVSPSKRAQFFWGMETGNLWYRRMDPTKSTGNEDDFLEWNMISGLSDDYFSILTVPSIIVDPARGEINGNKPLPWMVIQDPRCNASVDAANTQNFRVNRTGIYDVTMCGHITAAPDNTNDASNVGADYTYTLTNVTTGHMVQTPKTKKGVKVPKAPAFNKGMYPPVRMSFTNVPMKAGDLYKITLNQSRNAGMTEIYLDSFKNYLVIQPSASNTKQGIVIAESLRSSLGGFSSKAGYEVHVEGVKNNAGYVRVFGSVVNDKLVIG